MTSPDRDPRVLRDPALKVAPGMLAAFDAATDLEGRYPRLAVRVIDADELLERMLPRRAPRNQVEVFIDTTGVMVVGTGWDSSRPVYRALMPLPDPVSPLTARAFDAVLARHVDLAAKAIAAWTAYRSPAP